MSSPAVPSVLPEIESSVIVIVKRCHVVVIVIWLAVWVFSGLGLPPVPKFWMNVGVASTVPAWTRA